MLAGRCCIVRRLWHIMRHALRSNRRRIRVRRTGDPRPRARTPGAGARGARLRLARGPQRVGARRPPERRPACVRPERGGAGERGGRRLPVPRQRARGRAGADRRGRRRRPLRRAPPRRRRALSRLVRVRAPAPRRSRRVELCRPGAKPAGGPPRRQPRLLRDRRDSGARAARPARRRRDRRQVRRLRSRPRAEGVLARGLCARERLAVPRRQPSACARDRAGARLPGLLRAAPAAGAPRPHRDLLRRPRPRRARVAGRRLRRVARGASASCRHRPRARARAGDGRRRDRRVRGPRDGAHDRRLRARQPRQGRRRPGRAEREPRARARRDARAAPRGGARVSVTAPRGFVASGVHCGLRRQRPDVAIVRSLAPAVGAGMFTVNRVQAAPVVGSREHLELAEPQAVVANSANANAATGERGELDARATAAEAARLLGLHVEEVLLLSTGVIGVPLPLSTLLGGVRQASTALGPDGGGAAEAILTTDTKRKQAVAHGSGFAVGGMAKGSGMIHPHMATMLAVLTTDYPLGPGEAIDFLRPAVEASFNSISVDGECSTNDAVLLLANGTAPVERSPATDAELEAALHGVCADLAAQIVADGEGVTLTAEIAVESAPSDGEARAVAERVATSPLVKTALFGRDANWGRILAAAGSARFNGGFARLDPARLSVRVDGVDVYSSGRPTGEEPVLDGGHVAIQLDLGLGGARATYLTSDLSYDYVRINADYRS